MKIPVLVIGEKIRAKRRIAVEELRANGEVVYLHKNKFVLNNKTEFFFPINTFLVVFHSSHGY